jgi:hypothetical protein
VQRLVRFKVRYFRGVRYLVVGNVSISLGAFAILYIIYKGGVTCNL